MCEAGVSETEHITTILGKKIKKQTKPRIIIAYCPAKICMPKKHCANPQKSPWVKTTKKKKKEFTEAKGVISHVTK